MQAERRLAQAVLASAVEDLRSKPSPKGHYVQWLLRVAEARSFLTDTTGPWAQSREMWCSLADICPRRLRTWALAVPVHPAMRRKSVAQASVNA